ncbi:hypothetical protein QE152_g23425 [Popillia japonica]|uniref:Uncharacterized protein n=1 Tax=Popillia japonica TaxID=7064 RepID=A0AAW1KF61_POPJA
MCTLYTSSDRVIMRFLCKDVLHRVELLLNNLIGDDVGRNDVCTMGSDLFRAADVELLLNNLIGDDVGRNDVCTMGSDLFRAADGYK